MQQMNEQSQPKPPEPTERAQIVINYNFAAAPIVFRFNDAKRAEKEYRRLYKQWLAWPGANVERLFEVNADMFIGSVDLSSIACVAFVDLKKHAKFVPWQ
jgi:hypothetical protein